MSTFTIDPTKQRYHFANGSNPELRASMHMMGPQAADQVPDSVKEILKNPAIKYVAIVYDNGLGERVDVYSELVTGKVPQIKE